MKKTVLLLLLCLTTVLCIGLIGCDNSERKESVKSTERQTTESVQTPSDKVEKKDYSLKTIDGASYIVFDEVSGYQDNSQSQQLATVEFKSIAEFKDAVTNGKLTDFQKRIIATAFPRNEKGILICDMDNLFEPRVPSDCEIGVVTWSGLSYSFSITTSSDVFGYIYSFEEDNYEKRFEEDYENYFSEDNITVTETVQAADGKTVTKYETSMAKLMQIRYTLSDGDRVIIVDEMYCLESTYLPVSSSVPTVVTLYCQYGGAYYSVRLFEFDKRPSESWLIQFGMVPFK